MGRLPTQDEAFPAPKSFRILIAEDNPADVFLIREALKVHSIPCFIDTVETGDEFLAYAREICGETEIPKPDAIILDWSLPKNTGAELVRGIRETERCADALIFVLTSSLFGKDRDDALSAGANHFISKPTELDRFMEIGALVRDELFKHK